jgi:heme-degrading monooxygenase HmoA
MAIAKERAPQFQAMPGLLQKYYIKADQPCEFGGVYVWDSMESLKSYLESDLSASIAEAYKVQGQPLVEVYDTVFQLRE